MIAAPNLSGDCLQPGLGHHQIDKPGEIQDKEDKAEDKQSKAQGKPLKTQETTMIPEKLEIAPHVTKSEPNTPVYATTALPEEAPDKWFAPVSHREYLAIMTMEHIPQILHDMSLDHTTVSAADSFSPRLMPLLDRMKFYFSRTMAIARCEAEHGVFDWCGIPGRKNVPKNPILKNDCMSGLHVESFLAGIEEIRLADKDKRVVFRRYWRIIAPPPNFELTLGGVMGTGSLARHHVVARADRHCWEHWHKLPKLLVAEFTVDEKGLATAGRMLNNDENDDNDE